MTTASLRAQLHRPISVVPRVNIWTGNIHSPSLEVMSFDKTANLGIAEYVNTRFRRAFRVLGPSTPRKCRGYMAEDRIELMEIDTVAENGGIQAELGKIVPGRWIVPVLIP